MSRFCQLTGRKTTYGNKMKHRRGSSGGSGKWRFKASKTRRTWQPNLRKARLLVGDKVVNTTISMKAYKALRNKGAVNGVRLAQ